MATIASIISFYSLLFIAIASMAVMIKVVVSNMAKKSNTTQGIYHRKQLVKVRVNDSPSAKNFYN